MKERTSLLTTTGGLGVVPVKNLNSCQVIEIKNLS